MLGGQAAGAAPLVLGHPVDNPQTIATAIRIGRPASWDGAVNAATESSGEFRALPDAELLTAARQIAHLEGIFCEPSSAAGVAALRASVAAGHTRGAARCVCVLTGHGLKDTQAALLDLPSDPSPPVVATPDAVAKALGW
jgi:threonine synthase